MTLDDFIDMHVPPIMLGFAAGVLITASAGLLVGAATRIDSPPAIPDDPAPVHAQQLYVWFIPTACNPKCGEHWVYMLWDDGVVWRRLCDKEDCGEWEPL